MSQRKTIQLILDNYIKDINNKNSFGGMIAKNLNIIYPPHKLIINTETDILFSLKVNSDVCNVINSMHGGAVTTLIDETTSLSTTFLDKHQRDNLSINLSTFYYNPVKNNQTIFILNRVGKIGKNVAYCTADLYDENLKPLTHSMHVLSIKNEIKPKF